MTETRSNIEETVALAPAEVHGQLTKAIDAPAQQTLIRMFRDPRVLEADERQALVKTLAAAVEQYPQSADLRTVYGMALCVDYQPQTAMEELREAARLEPQNFLARLKFGELMMRLRILDQAEEHTMAAAKLAANDLQAEMARRQSATIRQLRRDGIERSTAMGFVNVFRKMIGLGGWRANRRAAALTVASR